jgi:hypothetical protein
MPDTMITNLLAIPLVEIAVQTGNNEDWVDSMVFLIDETGGQQLDIRGIEFEMEVRRQPKDHEVILSASTKAGTLQIGDPPNYGFLIINIPLNDIKTKIPGSYFGDIRGTDAQHTRRVVVINLAIVEGLTKGPLP